MPASVPEENLHTLLKGTCMVKKFIESYGLAIICLLAAIAYVAVADAAVIHKCI